MVAWLGTVPTLLLCSHPQIKLSAVVRCGPSDALGRPQPVRLYCLLLLQTNSALGGAMVHKCRVREGEGTPIVMRKLYFTELAMDPSGLVSTLHGSCITQIPALRSHSSILPTYSRQCFESVLKRPWRGGTRARSNCSKLLKKKRVVNNSSCYRVLRDCQHRLISVSNL